MSARLSTSHPARLLGTHVHRRPENDAEAGHQRARQRRRHCDRSGGVRVRLRRLGEPEIKHLYYAVGPELDVGRGRDRAMIDASFIESSLQRFGHLARNPERVVERQRSVGDPICQRVTVDEFEHKRANPFDSSTP